MWPRRHSNSLLTDSKYSVTLSALYAARILNRGDEMKFSIRSLMAAAFVGTLTLVCVCTAQAQTQHLVISNDDNPSGNSATFYVAGGTATAPKLTLLKTVSTGGSGIGNGFFSTNGVTVIQQGSNLCAFVADGGSADIAGISIKSQTVTGKFKGSSADTGSFFGIGLATNGTFLYASFTDSNHIATFRVRPGCLLTFLRDAPAVGLNGFPVGGMALRGNILVVAYVDGSIQSFNVASGVPVSNNDEQFSTGFLANGFLPAAVDITTDGRFAIFGDACPTVTCAPTEVEVSDISSGKLTPTVAYGGGSLGGGVNSNNVMLSPDESLLYVSNNQSGQVTAANFDKSTGAVSAGCISSPLRGFGSPWTHTVGLATELTSGTGGVLFVAEFGTPSSLGILSVRKNGATCRLTESVNSPASDAVSPGLLSIGTFPPRPF